MAVSADPVGAAIIVKTLENRYPIFKAGEAAGTSMCRVLSMKSTVRPFHGPWGAYAPQG